MSDAYRTLLVRHQQTKKRAEVTEGELVAVRDRVRSACATLRDAVGSNGPENIESFAERAAARIAELEAQLRAMAEAAERAQTSCEFGCPDGESVCGQCEGLLSGIASSRAALG